VVRRSSTFYEPIDTTDVAGSSTILREEIFAPVLTITKFSIEAEAVETANDTEYTHTLTPDPLLGLG